MSSPLPLPLKVLASLRIATGVSAFIIPGFTTNLLSFPLPATSLLPVRLFGARELLLGALLATSKTPDAKRRIILAGAVVDALDFVACEVGLFRGEVEKVPASIFGGAAVSALVLAGLGWKAAALGRIGGVVKGL